MIHYLRDENNNTILDVEVYSDNEDDYKYVELKASVIIDNYSLFLLSIEDINEKFDFINIINELSELRGWLWEVYEDNKPENINAEVERMLTEAGEKINLIYVKD